MADKLSRVFDAFQGVCARLGRVFEARTYALERERQADMIAAAGRLTDAVVMDQVHAGGTFAAWTTRTTR